LFPAYEHNLVFRYFEIILKWCPKYENGEWKSRTNRELEEMNGGEKYSKMDKGAKDKLARSPGENGGG
jgi:hypothetical protein